MEPTDHNLRAFDEMHRRRRALRPGLPPIVKATLGDLTSKRVLHLQAGSGDASADLAEQGAVVTAVDASEAMLDAAREEFDLVYSPEGVIVRLADLDAWAQGMASALHPRGELLVYDDHPVALCLNGLQHWHYDYFEEGFWRLGRIVTTIVRAGFRVEALEEYPGERRVPGTFLLYARRAG